MHLWVVCFDVSDDKRRVQLSRYLESVGDRVQGSVFELQLRKPNELNSIVNKTQQLIEAQEDDVRFYPLCKQCKKRAHDHNKLPIALLPNAIIL